MKYIFLLLSVLLVFGFYYIIVWPLGFIFGILWDGRLLNFNKRLDSWGKAIEAENKRLDI